LLKSEQDRIEPVHAVIQLQLPVALQALAEPAFAHAVSSAAEQLPGVVQTHSSLTSHPSPVGQVPAV
jgi:hypothetical protein